MHLDRIDTAEEAGQKRTFCWAIDWPGWARAGKTPSSPSRRSSPTRRATRRSPRGGPRLPGDPGAVTAHDIYVVDPVPGGSGTDFGVPSAVTDADRRPADAAAAERIARLVAAAWTVVDRVAAGAPAELRKGPRGGGRDTARIVAHVLDSDHAYAREIGVRLSAASPADRAAVEAERAATLDVLRRPSDGSPLADRRWPARYAARRIAWHALDHAWEIEDRSEPA